MKWFKHYNDSTDGQSMQLLISEKDFETAFIYWFILEQISKFEDTTSPEKRGRITLNFAFFKRKLGLNFQRTDRVLQKIAKTFILEITINLDQTIEVFAPNWLELQENRGSKTITKNREKSVKKRQEERGENKETEADATSADFLIPENEKTHSIETVVNVAQLQGNKQINHQNSTASFHARFSQNGKTNASLLDEYKISKRLKFYIGQINLAFPDPNDFEAFLIDRFTCPACVEIEKNSSHDLRVAELRIVNYVIACVLGEIGVKKQKPFEAAT